MGSCSDNIDGFSFILQSTLTAMIIANNLEPEEQYILGIFLDDVGSNLLSISAFNKYIKTKCENSTDEQDNSMFKKPSLF